MIRRTAIQKARLKQGVVQVQPFVVGLAATVTVVTNARQASCVANSAKEGPLVWLTLKKGRSVLPS